MCYPSDMQKQEVIGHLKKLASQQKTKKYLTIKDISSVPKLRYYVRVHFRTIGNALKAAGLPSSQLSASMSIKSEDLLSYLRDLRNELGHAPRVWDIEHDRKIYQKYSDKKFSWKIYKTRFGGLIKARELMETKDRDTSVTGLSATKKMEIEDFEFSQEKKRFWGQAAELHVTAELLYRGFQAANIPVDVGLDILAVRKNKTYYFQVKHKDLSNYKPIKLTKSSFERSGGGDVYYIFVLLSDEKRDFLIIPYHIVNDWIREGIAEDTDKGYLIHITKKDSKLRLKEKELDKYLERWEDIK